MDPNDFTRSMWEYDSIQFPRLLAEIMATQENLDVDALCESMDLQRDDVFELFNRAQERWEAHVESLRKEK